MIDAHRTQSFLRDPAPTNAEPGTADAVADGMVIGGVCDVEGAR